MLKPGTQFYKQAWLLLLILLSVTATAQINCTITADVNMPACKGTFVNLSVPFNNDYLYSWSPGGETTSEIVVKATQTITYQVTVTSQSTSDVCISDPFVLDIRPTFDIAFEQIQLTCSNGDEDNGNNAMLKATASGEGSPYTYLWNVRPIQIAPDNPSLAIGLKAHLWYFIDIESSNGCMQRDSVFTKAYTNPEIEILADPDTAYIQNPYVTFTFENLSIDSIAVTNFFWDFGDETPTSDLPNPRHQFPAEDTYQVILTVRNPQGCDTTYSTEIQVLPVKLKIPNVITPNNDGINDYFIISEDTNTENVGETSLKAAEYESYKPISVYYQKTSLVIFNRQGRKVFESSDYQNNWDGGDLKDGVYFYVLHCEGFKSNETFKGSITIFDKK
ncbi:MAG: gliding motility-associated C-terminal domain-containing protein [Bacteroidales bacterium]